MATESRDIDIRQLGLDYADVLRDIANGHESITVVSDTWDDIYAGNVRFRSKGWEFVIFNDCDSLDYTDLVIAPDGRQADFDELFDHESDPIRFRPLVDKIDQRRLELAFKRARRG